MSTFDFGNLIGRDQIALIYTAYYGRLPDPEGFSFWERFFLDETGAGRSATETILEITDFFLDQVETRANYAFFENPELASTLDISRFLDEVYYNLFNRPPDAAGRDFWSDQIVGRLESGESFSDLLVQIIEGAQATDISAMDNKLAVGRYYVENIGDNFDLAQATRIALDTTAEANSAEENIANIDAFLADGATYFDAGRSDTHFLVSDLNGGEIGLVDITTGTTNIIANTGLSTMTDIAVTPAGDLLLVDFGTLYRYSFASNTTEQLITFPTSINAIETDENGQLFAAGPFGTQLYQVDLETFALTQIGDLPAGAAGDISVARDSLYVTLINDQLVFVETDNPANSEVVQTDFSIGSFFGLVQMGDQFIAGAGDNIINITTPNNYVVNQTILDPAFNEISGASYVYDSLVDYLLA